MASRETRSEPAPPRPGDVVQSPLGGGRETVESIVVAFVLALLFRSFEAEAFVIPTGSMAPTLMGRHRDLVCETCGEDFQIGCSKELNEATCRLEPRAFVRRARCPNCGAETRLTDASGRYLHEFPPFTGDRIIVEKFAYDFVEPSRWDVVVFKYPEDARVNYIKRLIGLPGETVSIAGGDIWTDRGTDEPAIARKPPERLLAMLQCVHDSRHRPAESLTERWPPAWTDWSARPAESGWASADDGRSFQVAVSADPTRPAELRWRHCVPRDWDPAAPPAAVEPALVGDFQPYNQDPEYVGLHRIPGSGVTLDGAHWVGDLAVECRLQSRGDGGSVTLDLVEAGVRNECLLDLASGIATLSRDGTALGAADCGIRGRGQWQVVFANVDDELSLFVNGRRVATDKPTTWVRSIDEAAEARPVVRGATVGDSEPDDLSPVGITAREADLTVADLRVLRDVYYVASGTQAALIGREPEEPVISFPLEEDQFFMLGDNSSASKDGRAWGTPEEPIHHVDRRLLIGRALVVFWPHAVPTPWNAKVAERCGWELRLPCLPNFARMRFVR